MLKKLVPNALKAFLKLRLERRRLQSRLRMPGRKRIIVGAGGTEFPDWIPTDRELLDVTDPESWAGLCRVDSLDAVLSEHVFEHLTEGQMKSALECIFKYLCPGGYVRIAVPDGFHPDSDYIEYVRPGGVGPGADDHKQLLTLDSIRVACESVGFEVRPLEYWENNKFYANDWEPDDGFISRSIKYDQRNVDGEPRYTSLLIDAIKSEVE